MGEIAGHLVDDPVRIRRQALQRRQIVFGCRIEGGGVQRGDPPDAGGAIRVAGFSLAGGRAAPERSRMTVICKRIVEFQLKNKSIS